MATGDRLEEGERQENAEAYSRDTFDYLLTTPESVAYRAVMQNGAMSGFVIGLLEPDHTGHITTIGIAPEHRRRRLAGARTSDHRRG